MIATNHSISPAGVALSLTLAVEVFAEWQAGKVVVMDYSGITVDGKQWQHRTGKSVSNQSRHGRECVFRFDGNICKITFDGKEVCVPATKGLRYIQYLIQHPWEDIHASKLVAMLNGEAPVCGDDETEEAVMNKTLSIETERREIVLTPGQRKGLEKQLEELKEEMDDRKKLKEPTNELEAEIEKWEKYLDKVGFGSHAAKAKSQSDRDRKSVTKAIKFAIKIVSAQHPSLGLFLRKSFKCGFFILYKPIRPIEWVK